VNTILAIDGGTHQTGWAVFDGVSLIDAGIVTAPPKAWTHERIGIIICEIDGLILKHKPDMLVCEGSFSRWTPELGLLIKELKQLARLRKLECRMYNASTVIRTVSGKKVPGLRKNRKALLTAAVAKYHPAYAQLAQDAIDAICIGRTHLLKAGLL
jgi:Holliday junction resolvasome RuvABC endonuclease subunit